MDRIKIALVDDQILFRQSLSALISSNKAFDLVAEFGSGYDYLNNLPTMTSIPDIAIIDMEMPHMNGMELNALLHKQYPTMRVIVLSIHAKERLIAKMIENGASGYLIKNCDKHELFTAINSVYNSGFYINHQVLQAIQNAAAYKNKPIQNLSGIDIDISKREAEILQMICKELSATEIAEKLFISSRTVDGHRTNLLAKTGCKNTAGLVIFAIKHGVYEIRF